MKIMQMWEVGYFIRKLQVQMRFGELSRKPLKLLRLELRAENAECEWLARPNDPWDLDLPIDVRRQLHTSQALLDALQVREFMFASLPEIRSAVFKTYRQGKDDELELIVLGAVNRSDQVGAHIASLAMRAKLYGLHFSLQDGVLESLPLETTGFVFSD